MEDEMARAFSTRGTEKKYMQIFGQETWGKETTLKT
jgi:hypothetical protein